MIDALTRLGRQRTHPALLELLPVRHCCTAIHPLRVGGVSTNLDNSLAESAVVVMLGCPARAALIWDVKRLAECLFGIKAHAPFVAEYRALNIGHSMIEE